MAIQLRIRLNESGDLKAVFRFFGCTPFGSSRCLRGRVGSDATEQFSVILENGNLYDGLLRPSEVGRGPSHFFMQLTTLVIAEALSGAAVVDEISLVVVEIGVVAGGGFVERLWAEAALLLVVLGLLLFQRCCSRSRIRSCWHFFLFLLFQNRIHKSQVFGTLTFN